MTLSLELPAGSAIPEAEIRRRAYPFRASGDSSATRVSGYASVFGSLNSYGEVFVPGAFREELAEVTPDKPLVMGLYHREAIGKWEVPPSTENAQGLHLDGPISDTSAGRDAAVLARDGVLTGLSIGFWPEIYQFAESGESVTFDTPYGRFSYIFQEPVIYVLKAELVEASLVIAPSDDDARVTGVRSMLAQATRALPALAEEETPWEDAAYSMALLMGGRGAGAFSELPHPERRALYNRLCTVYERHEKEPPEYEHTPDFKLVNFRHDERELFADRYLRKALATVDAGARGIGALSDATREAARQAVDALAPLLSDEDEELRSALAEVSTELLSTTQAIQEAT